LSRPSSPSETHSPTSIGELREVVLSTSCLLAAGGGTKWTQNDTSSPVTRVSLSNLNGIVEYQPDEYTITARAGTPIRELVSVLAENGQYLPFDPPFVKEGASLGGTVASGMSGSKSQRHGRLRDFILAVEFMTGDGRVARGGAKVVKNSAGFDLPKLMVGSLGRFGLLTEVTLKVFPAPATERNIRFACHSLDDAVDQIVRLNCSCLVLDGLDLIPPETLQIRLGGQADAIGERIDRLKRFLDRKAVIITGINPDFGRESAKDSDHLWVKVAVRPSMIARYQKVISKAGGICRYFFGGATAWMEWPGSCESLDSILVEHSLTGILFRGLGAPHLIGHFPGLNFYERIKAVLDPDGRFPPIDARSVPPNRSHEV
jgi:glycolate oxidase FAD binding subunit